jgi:hypothetical protein
MEQAVITGSQSSIVCTNVDNTITGFGVLGDGKLILVNAVAGVIDAAFGNMIVNTGSDAVNNAGVLEASNGGVLVLHSAVENSGILSVNGGKLRALKAVTGSGSATINRGTLYFKSSFDEAVTFTDQRGLLRLGRSQSYTAAITGFSAQGGTSLDLVDIGFVSADEATFSGTAMSGVLTVSDGTHVAHIDLIGDYLGVTFIAKSDAHGGARVVASGGERPMPVQDPSAAAAPVHVFVAAMAGFGASAASHALSGRPEAVREMMLSSPRVAIA